MFVETKTGGESQTPVIGRDDFIAWLRTKKADETYNFMDYCGKCAVGQYMKARGIKWSGPAYGRTVQHIFGSLITCLVADGEIDKPQNFGALLQRMLALRGVA